MSNRIRLGDDGTLDTVLVCRECGQEARYSYDGAPFMDDDRREVDGEADYNAFVTWAIEDFDSEHVCEGDTE